MALCAYQCETCSVHFTVRISHDDNKYAQACVNAIIARNSIIELYDDINDSFNGEGGNFAVVLNVSGADIAIFCPQINRAADLMPVELF